MKVKAILILATCLAFLSGTSAVAQVENGAIEQIIKGHMSNAELTNVVEQLASKDIDLIIDDSEFVCDKLTYIKFTLVYEGDDRVGYESKYFSEDRAVSITATPRSSGGYGFRVAGA